MYFALADGIILFDKDSGVAPLIVTAKEILKNAPPVNKKWENERYKTKRRSDLIEIYMDLLDVEDETEFNYIVALLIANALPLVLENNKLWPRTRKTTISHLKSQCFNGYKYVETLLSSVSSLQEKRDAAKGLTDYALKPHGGILNGDALIFRITKQ